MWPLTGAAGWTGKCVDLYSARRQMLLNWQEPGGSRCETFIKDFVILHCRHILECCEVVVLACREEAVHVPKHKYFFVNTINNNTENSFCTDKKQQPGERLCRWGVCTSSVRPLVFIRSHVGKTLQIPKTDVVIRWQSCDLTGSCGGVTWIQKWSIHLTISELYYSGPVLIIFLGKIDIHINTL